MNANPLCLAVSLLLGSAATADFAAPQAKPGGPAGGVLGFDARIPGRQAGVSGSAEDSIWILPHVPPGTKYYHQHS